MTAEDRTSIERDAADPGGETATSDVFTGTQDAEREERRRDDPSFHDATEHDEPATDEHAGPVGDVQAEIDRD